MMIMWKPTVFVLLVLVNFTPALDVENLKLGCFSESPSSREFYVSPGDYQPESLTPYDCVKICGNMKYSFAALQNGNLCFCANSFNASYGASAGCNINCTGDQSYRCGGVWANLVYNSSSYAKKFVINYFGSLRVFERVNMSAGFMNDSTSGLQVAFNIGDGNGDSPGQNERFDFIASYWGKMIVKVQALNINPKRDFVNLELYIRANPDRAEFVCPRIVRAGEKFRCIARIHEGTGLRAKWLFKNGDTKNASLPNPLYVRAGPAVPQWVVTGLTTLHSTGLFLLSSFQFSFQARILALEIYGHTAGEIKVFVVRPICSSPAPYYCPKNLSCSNQPCYVHPSFSCSFPDILCASKSCCHLPPSGNCSQSSGSMTLTASNLTVIADIGVLAIKTGYNLHMLPKNQTFNVLPGDMIAWGPASDGKVALQTGNATTYHFSALDVNVLQTGSNMSVNYSQAISNVSYMINIVGSQASTLEFSHQYSSSGEYWAAVNFTDTLGNSLTAGVQSIVIQDPLTSIQPVYPGGFSFLGARMNQEIQILVNVSTNTTVIVSWTLVNSSTQLKHEVLQSQGNDFVVSKLNQTFNSLGLYILFVKAANNVSSVNATILIRIQDTLSELNVSLISSPVYLAAPTKFNVSVRGTNVKFKWIFGDGSWTPYISNTSIVHSFSQLGALNVTVMASNLAFSKTAWLMVNVLQPLRINVPLQGVVGVHVNMSCLLIGSFASDQYFYWNYGDGATEEGLNKNQVTHNYSKGGTFNVSVKLKNEALVHASSEILVLEKVSGLTVDNFTGVELFDNKTFIARTTTGNNLTYEWYLHSNKTITIFICTKDSLELFFNSTGLYTITVNVSNSVSFELATISFYVQRRITGLGITAVPNPAPSNSTITFNLTKGTGSDVKYRLDFGDGFVLRDFSSNYLFNRTFSSGQWQIIFTGENAVNHMIVFYNLTVQDPIKNISVGLTAKTEFNGHRVVAVGSETILYSRVSEGTDVYFRWNFGDGSYTNTYKGSRILTSGFNHSVAHFFPRSGNFNVTVSAFNAISHLETWIITHAQQGIEGFELIANDGAILGSSTRFQFLQTKGDNISYIVHFSDEGRSRIITANSINKTYNSVGVFNVTVKAANQISSRIMTKTIIVQRQIQGFTFVHQIVAVETGTETVISWIMSDGSDVTFVVDFGDGTEHRTINSNVFGTNVSVSHNYTTWGDYLVKITAYNLVGPNKTISGKAMVDDPIVGLAAYAEPNTAQMYDNVTIVATILKGSRVTYHFDFGDGSTPVETLTNNVIHHWTKHSWYTITITAKNSLTSPHPQVRKNITVVEPNNPLEIRGLNVSCQATVPGKASEIRVTYQYGYMFQCEVDFGDKTKKSFSDSSLTLPLLHKYNSVGGFEVVVKCGNLYGNHTVSATAHVDDVINGVTFKTGNGTIQKYFNQSVVIEWIWSTGTNVQHSVTLSGRGRVTSHQINGRSGALTLDRTLCQTPGEYVVKIELSNSVSPPQKLRAIVTFLEDITGLEVRFNPVVRIGSPIPMYVSVESGLDVNVGWNYGDGNYSNGQSKGYGRQAFNTSHVYSTQREFEVEVITLNQNSRQSVKRKITILQPVQGFIFRQNNTVIWPPGSIAFQFGRSGQVPDLRNATYRIDFGNGHVSGDKVIDPVKTQFSYNYSYSKPGCYKAKLIIWNFVSRVELSAPVEIIEKITNASLKAVHSNYSVHPGASGGGPNGNTFPFEYPVSFLVAQDTGTCLQYDWLYGDDDELRNVSTNVAAHAYPLPGNYNVEVNIYNSIGRETLRRTITLQYSLRGLYLASSGPAKPHENVTFVVFCLSLGTNSQFVFNAGEGDNITLTDFKNNTLLKAEKFLEPNINLPFDPSSFFAKVYSHFYSKDGLFEAQVWGSNNASQKSSRAQVVITYKPVPVFRIQVIGGKKSLFNSSSLIYGKRFSLSSRVEILDNENYTVNFKWAVYKADSYHAKSHVQLPPETGREVSLQPEVTTNQSSITIPASVLDPGKYIFKVTVTISDVYATKADYTYIEIGSTDIEAHIAGGNVRSHGWEQHLSLDATESRDPLFTENEELDYSWLCSITEGNGAVISSRLGCFGNGENQVEFTGKVFTLSPRSLFEATTYVFTVNVSSEKTGRWSTATQTVKVLMGNPPNIKIRCESNCEKYLNPYKRLILTTTCPNCDDIQAISYNWSAEHVHASVPFKLWPDRALTLQNGHSAVIRGKTFNSSSSYRIRVVASRLASGAQGFAEYDIITNQPPRGGTCDVTPKTGEEMKTRFTFSCSGWQDEHEPLTYKMFYLHPSESNDRNSYRELLFHGPSLTKAEFLLPAGRENGHVMEVVVIIMDAYGMATESKLEIKVNPRIITFDELKNKSLAPGNEIRTAIGIGANMVALHLINSVSNILNSQNDTNKYIEDKQRIRLTMIKYLADFRPQTLDDVLLSSQTLQAVTGVARETTVRAQVLAAKQFSMMAEKLRKESKSGEDGGVIEKISNVILRGLSNVFLASLNSRGNTSNALDKKTSEEVLVQVLNLMDSVSDAVLDTMIPAQNAVIMKSDSVAVGLSKQTPCNLAGLSVSVGGEAQFVLPNDINLMDGISNSSFTTTTLTELSINPFQSSGNSTMVRTNPVSLIVKGPDGNVIPVEGLASPINISLPQKVPLQMSTNVSQTPSASGSMTIHKVSLPNSDSIVKAKILPSDGSSALEIYFRYSEPPSLTEYDFKISLPNMDSVGGNHSLFVTRDQMKGAGDYYVGVLPSAHDSEGELSGKTINYTFDVISSACYFWNEISLDWSTQGCLVHSQSTRNLTRCQCTHLTWFGADLFIPPNKLNIEASIKKLADIHKHPALLATYCCIIGLYILALVWVRRADRKDSTKVGLVPVLDNDPSDRYRYEVTVYTARGKNTGTTANVSIVISGEDGQSAVHMLKSTSRTCLQPGGVDSFLITTSDCLGGLTFIRVWHDNSGKSPSWFLSQVVIRDIETDEKFFFLCNHWLACDEGDGQVDRLFPVAGKEELSDFVHLFKTKTSRDFSDGHLWFSIAFRPVRSRFTRVQRVTCCLSLLMCSMLSNVLWYRTPMKKQNNVLIDFGFFEFTWHEIIIGIQSSLIVFPINLVIVQLFRNRSASPKAKQKYAERITARKHSKISVTERAKARKQTTVSLSDITPADSPSERGVLKQKQVTLKNLTSIRSPVTMARKDSWDEEFFCSLLESQVGASSGDKKKKFKRHESRDKEDLEGEMPDVLSSDIYYYLYQDVAQDQEKACSRDSIESTTVLVSTEKPKEIKKKRKRPKFLFPWWFLYIGWFLCLSTAAAAGFFTLLYGLQFDNTQQEEWLVSMFVSMFQDVLISQPLKVIIVAILFALLLKRPQDEDDDVINAELARDEEWLEETLKDEPKGKTAVTQCQRPPDKVLLQAARVRLFKERKMHSVIREIVFYLLFVWIVLLIAYGHRDPYAHFMTQNMENTFVGNQESPGAREDGKQEVTTDKPTGNDSIKLADVSNIIDFWEWVNQTLVPGLYNGAWYNGNSGEPGFLDDKMSYVVGVARIRQLRVKSGTCQVHEVFETHAGTCDEPYSWDAEDQTPHFAPGWRQTNQNSSYNSDCSAWHYKTTAELKTRPFLGNLALYRGGGYKVDLGSTINEAYSVLSDLKLNGWVDKYTRAVFVEFTVYNGHSNLYCVANLLLEFTAAGGVLPFIQLLSTRIDRYVGHFLIFVLVCEVSFVFFTLLFTYREFKRFLKTELKNYMTQFWTWIELILIGLSWTAIVLYGIRFGLDKYTKKTFRENPRQFVDFHHLALVDQLFGYVYAFVVFATSVKFLRLFRFNRRMSLLGCTIKAAARELAHFGIIFGLVFIGFSHLCYLVFSHELYKFHTFVTTLETLISVMLGKFSYVSLERTNRVLGPIMFFFYSIGVVFILINMFLSIIIENFKKVKQDNDLQSNEHEIIDFMTDQFLNWLGLKSRSIFKTRVAPEEECTRPRYKKLKSIDEAQQLKERVDRLVTLIKEVHFDVREGEDFLRNDGEVTYLVP